MALEVSVTSDKQNYLVGDPVTVSWTVTSTSDQRTIQWSGVDQAGNQVNGTLTINVDSEFTMNRVFWADTGEDLVLDNDAQVATGTV